MQKHFGWKVNLCIVENYTIKNWQSICPEIATPSLKALKAGAALLNIGGLGTTSKSSFIQILGLGFIGNKNWQKKLQKKKLASSQNGQKRSFFITFVNLPISPPTKFQANYFAHLAVGHFCINGLIF